MGFSKLVERYSVRLVNFPVIWSVTATFLSPHHLNQATRNPERERERERESFSLRKKKVAYLYIRVTLIAFIIIQVRIFFASISIRKSTIYIYIYSMKEQTKLLCYSVEYKKKEEKNIKWLGGPMINGFRPRWRCRCRCRCRYQ
jgi:hypothetical protein